MNKIGLFLGMLIMQSTHAEVADCYEKYELTPPKSTNYIVLIDNHDPHSQSEKKAVEQWIGQLKGDDQLFIYNYSYGITPEINTVFIGRNPTGIKLTLNKNDKVEDKKFVEDGFADCININTLKWAASQSRIISSSFRIDQDEATNNETVDNLKKIKLFTQFLIPQNKNNNKIIWISKLKQEAENNSLTEGDIYLDVNPHELLLNLPSSNSIIDRNIRNSEIEILSSPRIQGRQRESFNKVRLFWEQYFLSLGITVINK